MISTWTADQKGPCLLLYCAEPFIVDWSGLLTLDHKVPVLEFPLWRQSSVYDYGTSLLRFVISLPSSQYDLNNAYGM